MPSIESSTSRRVRFIGKHSKDQGLSLYVQERTTTNNQLNCILKINREIFQDDEPSPTVMVVGVLARLVCDFKIQHHESVIWQAETPIYPRSIAETDQPKPFFDLEISQSELGARLPDQWHVPFRIYLPPEAPPSIYLHNTLINGSHWGISYYVFAYATTKQAVDLVLKHPKTTMNVWPRVSVGDRSSKVFLAFSKVNPNSSLNSEISWIEAHRKLSGLGAIFSNGTIFSSKTASLSTVNGSFHRNRGICVLRAKLRDSVIRNNLLEMDVQLENYGTLRISHLKVTIKQLFLFEQTGNGNGGSRQIKTTICEWNSYEKIDRNSSDRLERLLSIPIDINQSLNSNIGGSLFQVALKSAFPRPDTHTAQLMHSWHFSGSSTQFGLERLRKCSISYYANVHAVVPLGQDIIVSLPFVIDSSDSSVSIDGSQPVAGNSKTQDLVVDPALFETIEEHVQRCKGSTSITEEQACSVEKSEQEIDNQILIDLLDFEDCNEQSYTTPPSTSPPPSSCALSRQGSCKYSTAMEICIKYRTKQAKSMPRVSIDTMELVQRNADRLVCHLLPRIAISEQDAVEGAHVLIDFCRYHHQALMNASDTSSDEVESALEQCSQCMDDYELMISRLMDQRNEDLPDLIIRLSDRIENLLMLLPHMRILTKNILILASHMAICGFIRPTAKLQLFMEEEWNPTEECMQSLSTIAANLALVFEDVVLQNLSIQNLLVYMQTLESLFNCYYRNHYPMQHQQWVRTAHDQWHLVLVLAFECVFSKQLHSDTTAFGGVAALEFCNTKDLQVPTSIEEAAHQVIESMQLLDLEAISND